MASFVYRLPVTSKFCIVSSIYAVTLFSSVVDKQPFYADPDPNFHVDVDPDPDPDWHQNNADPHTDPTPSFTHVLTLLVPILPLYNVLSFSSVSNVS